MGSKLHSLGRALRKLRRGQVFLNIRPRTFWYFFIAPGFRWERTALNSCLSARDCVDLASVQAVQRLFKHAFSTNQTRITWRTSKSPSFASCAAIIHWRGMDATMFEAAWLPSPFSPTESSHGSAIRKTISGYSPTSLNERKNLKLSAGATASSLSQL